MTIAHLGVALLVGCGGGEQGGPPGTSTAAMEFYDAASEPKLIEWYDAAHGLNEQARLDRADWLAMQLAPEPAR